MRRHLLLLAYYFPPMGLSGVQRMSKFVKYLPDSGWDVTVVTTRPRGYFAYDATLEEELRREGVRIVRTRSIDPTRLFGSKSVVSLPGESRRRSLNMLTGFLLVPDNKVGWYPFAYRAALREHRRRPFNAILSSAPPYSAHVAARRIGRKLDVPVVVDFRDDWIGNPRHVYPTPVHRRLQEVLEKRVLDSAAQIVTINRIIADSLQGRRSAREAARPVSVLPQGYDPEDFPSPLRRLAGEEQMRLLYSGIFYDAQTPEPFLDGLKVALDREPSARQAVRADFVGLVPRGFSESVERRGLTDVVRYQGYLTHADVVRELSSSDVLWFIIGSQTGAEGISTGKLYEYFGSRRPVLGLVPEGVARDDLLRYRAAEVAHPDDPKAVAAAILKLWNMWSDGTLPIADEAFAAGFDRRAMSAKFADILESVIGAN